MAFRLFYQISCNVKTPGLVQPWTNQNAQRFRSLSPERKHTDDANKLGKQRGLSVDHRSISRTSYNNVFQKQDSNILKFSDTNYKKGSTWKNPNIISKVNQQEECDEDEKSVSDEQSLLTSRSKESSVALVKKHRFQNINKYRLEDSRPRNKINIFNVYDFYIKEFAQREFKGLPHLQPNNQAPYGAPNTITFPIRSNNILSITFPITEQANKQKALSKHKSQANPNDKKATFKQYHRKNYTTNSNHDISLLESESTKSNAHRSKVNEDGLLERTWKLFKGSTPKPKPAVEAKESETLTTSYKNTNENHKSVKKTVVRGSREEKEAIASSLTFVTTFKNRYESHIFHNYKTRSITEMQSRGHHEKSHVLSDLTHLDFNPGKTLHYESAKQMTKPINQPEPVEQQPEEIIVIRAGTKADLLQSNTMPESLQPCDRKSLGKNIKLASPWPSYAETCKKMFHNKRMRKSVTYPALNQIKSCAVSKSQTPALHATVNTRCFHSGRAEKFVTKYKGRYFTNRCLYKISGITKRGYFFFKPRGITMFHFHKTYYSQNKKKKGSNLNTFPDICKSNSPKPASFVDTEDCSLVCKNPPLDVPPLERPKRRYKPCDPPRACPQPSYCAPRADTNLKPEPKRLKPLKAGRFQEEPIQLKEGKPLTRLKKKPVPEPKRVCPCDDFYCECPPRADDGLKVQKKCLPEIKAPNCPQVKPKCPVDVPPLKRLKKVVVPETPNECPVEHPCPQRADAGLVVAKKKLPVLKVKDKPCEPNEPLKDMPLKRLPKCKVEEPSRDCYPPTICDETVRADDQCDYQVKPKKLPTMILKAENNYISSRKYNENKNFDDKKKFSTWSSNNLEFRQNSSILTSFLQKVQQFSLFACSSAPNKYSEVVHDLIHHSKRNSTVTFNEVKHLDKVKSSTLYDPKSNSLPINATTAYSTRRQMFSTSSTCLKDEDACKKLGNPKCPKIKLPNCKPRAREHCVKDYKYKKCDKRKTPYPSFSECGEYKQPAYCECTPIPDQKFLQPKNPILPDLKIQGPPPPEFEHVSVEKEKQCVKKKLNMKEDKTKTCENFQSKSKEFRGKELMEAAKSDALKRAKPKLITNESKHGKDGECPTVITDPCCIGEPELRDPSKSGGKRSMSRQACKPVMEAYARKEKFTKKKKPKKVVHKPKKTVCKPKKKTSKSSKNVCKKKSSTSKLKKNACKDKSKTRKSKKATCKPKRRKSKCKKKSRKVVSNPKKVVCKPKKKKSKSGESACKSKKKRSNSKSDKKSCRSKSKSSKSKTRKSKSKTASKAKKVVCKPSKKKSNTNKKICKPKKQQSKSKKSACRSKSKSSKSKTRKSRSKTASKAKKVVCKPSKKKSATSKKICKPKKQSKSKKSACRSKSKPSKSKTRKSKSKTASKAKKVVCKPAKKKSATSKKICKPKKQQSKSKKSACRSKSKPSKSKTRKSRSKTASKAKKVVCKPAKKKSDTSKKICKAKKQQSKSKKSACRSKSKPSKSKTRKSKSKTASKAKKVVCKPSKKKSNTNKKICKGKTQQSTSKTSVCKSKTAASKPKKDACKSKSKDSVNKQKSKQNVSTEPKAATSDSKSLTPPKACDQKDKPKGLWARIVNFFKARPNCPEPGDWKKQKLRDNAVKAADAAGLKVCTPAYPSTKCAKKPAKCQPPTKKGASKVKKGKKGKKSQAKGQCPKKKKAKAQCKKSKSDKKAGKKGKSSKWLTNKCVSKAKRKPIRKCKRSTINAKTNFEDAFPADMPACASGTSHDADTIPIDACKKTWLRLKNPKKPKKRSKKPKKSPCKPTKKKPCGPPKKPKKKCHYSTFAKSYSKIAKNNPCKPKNLSKKKKDPCKKKGPSKKKEDPCKKQKKKDPCKKREDPCKKKKKKNDPCKKREDPCKKKKKKDPCKKREDPCKKKKKKDPCKPKPKKCQAAEEKCKKIKTNCPPRARQNCIYEYEFKPCKAQESPYPSYSECRPPFPKRKKTECDVAKTESKHTLNKLNMNPKQLKTQKQICNKKAKKSKGCKKGRRSYSTLGAVQKALAFRMPSKWSRNYSSNSGNQYPELLNRILNRERINKRNENLSERLLAGIEEGIRKLEAQELNLNDNAYYKLLKMLQRFSEEEINEFFNNEQNGEEFELNENARETIRFACKLNPRDEEIDLRDYSLSYEPRSVGISDINAQLEEVKIMEAFRSFCNKLTQAPNRVIMDYEESERLKTERMTAELDKLLWENQNKWRRSGAK